MATNTASLAIKAALLKYVVWTFLEIERSQQADHQDHDCHNAESEIGERNPGGAVHGQMILQQDQLNGQRSDQSESSNVVQKGEECGQGSS